MNFLVFHLHGPFASWGDIAVGEVRPSFNAPTRSALLGFISGALGISREEQSKTVELAEQLRFAVRIERGGQYMEEYQTIALPKGRGHENVRTRKMELLFSQENTMQSYRQHYMDAVYSVFVTTTDPAETDLLKRIQTALLRPYYIPFLGRKACPVDIPIIPRIVEASNLQDALLSEASEIPEALSSVLFPLKILSESHERRQVIADASFDDWNWLTEELRTNEPGSRTAWHFSKNRVRIGYDAPSTQGEN